jgi:flagellin
MSLSINTNSMSLNAQRNLANTQSSLATSMQRLSSGLRVNSSKDDAAGLAIAEAMTSQVRGQAVAIRNANDAISFAQTGEGALGSISGMLQRMRELAVQAANGTNDSDARTNLQTEFAQLQSEITRTTDATSFNGTAVLKQSAAVVFQVGADASTASNTISISGVDMTTGAVSTAIGGSTSVSGSDATNALAAITSIDSAIKAVTTARATFGAAQNRFDNAIGNLRTSVENQSAARGRILDADFATETANLSRVQVLQQAGTAMLQQANAMPNSVLALLRG